MLKFNKPKFWDKKKVSFFSLILFPFTLLTLLVIFFKKSFTTTKKYNIPIICVGNIYIGGTGKTPTSILIAKELLNYGIPSVILRKYYKDQEDEYKQIKNNFSNLIINKKRDAGIKDAISKGHKLVILDDGLQDYKIYKNLNIVCFNSGQLIGNGLVLPSGPLRENLNALKNTNIVIINGEKNISFRRKNPQN